MTIHFDESKQKEQLESLLKEDEENLIQVLSNKYGVPYIDLSRMTIDLEALRLIPEAEARKSAVGPFNLVGKKASIAVHSPQNPETEAAIKAIKEKGFQVELFMASMGNLEKVWAKYKDLSYALETKAGALDISEGGISNLITAIKSLTDIKALIEQTLEDKKSTHISKVLEVIIAGALSLRASDIHIEPEETYVRLRYRLDGVLNEIATFDARTFTLVLSRIKLISGLKLNVKNQAQDGRFSIHLNDSEIEVRTSLLPGAYDNSVVMRLLDPKSISVPLEELGIQPHLLKIILEQINRPKGMLLTTGPTGSGKTTTLYAFVKKIHTSEVKIITIEDPIEYHLPGIVQTQTDAEKGYTFLAGLRSALRQDPDVIMIGEIRDKETAAIAINSALTGHLVFSTLHTNTAAGAFPRLIDLKINPKIITSAMNLVLAQRLVRKLCPECRQEVKLEGANKKMFDEVIASVGNIEPIGNREVMYIPKGCDKCSGLGYRGRVGLYEGILVDEKIETAVVASAGEREIKQIAEKQGILDMKQDGILKILTGITSLDELSRVIDLEGIV